MGELKKMFLYLNLIPTFFFVSDLSLAQSGSSSKALGKITAVSGKAWIVHGADHPSKSPAQNGSVIRDGDTLTTDGNSEAQVILGEKEAAILLKKDSQLKMKQTPSKSWLLDLERGMLLSVVRPNSNVHKSQFQVKTKTSTLGIRGATFFVKMEVGRDLFLCTCNGMVTLDDKVLIFGKNHDSPKFIQTGDQPLAKRLKTAEKGRDHSDGEVTELKKLIGI